MAASANRLRKCPESRPLDYIYDPDYCATPEDLKRAKEAAIKEMEARTKVLNATTKQQLQLQIVGNNCVVQPRQKFFDVSCDEIGEKSMKKKENILKRTEIRSPLVLARNGALLDVAGINRFRYQQRPMPVGANGSWEDCEIGAVMKEPTSTSSSGYHSLQNGNNGTTNGVTEKISKMNTTSSNVSLPPVTKNIRTSAINKKTTEIKLVEKGDDVEKGTSGSRNSSGSMPKLPTPPSQQIEKIKPASVVQEKVDLHKREIARHHQNLKSTRREENGRRALAEQQQKQQLLKRRLEIANSLESRLNKLQKRHERVMRDLDRQSDELLCIFPSEDLGTHSATPKTPQNITPSPVAESALQLPDRSKNIRQISAPLHKLHRSSTEPAKLNPLRRMDSLQVPPSHPSTPPQVMAMNEQSNDGQRSSMSDENQESSETDDGEIDAVIDQLVQQALNEAADQLVGELQCEQAQLENEVTTFYEDCVLPEVHRLVLNDFEDTCFTEVMVDVFNDTIHYDLKRHIKFA